VARKALYQVHEELLLGCV